METMTRNTNFYNLQELGMFVRLNGTKFPKWELTDIQCILSQSLREIGRVVFFARDISGSPVRDLDFIVGWRDNLGYATQDYPGRYCFTLSHMYIPTIEEGPYWAGFFEEGVAAEVVGFGIPRGHNIEIKIIYTKLDGGSNG